jgi:hypothetical protein
VLSSYRDGLCLGFRLSLSVIASAVSVPCTMILKLIRVSALYVFFRWRGLFVRRPPYCSHACNRSQIPSCITKATNSHSKCLILLVSLSNSDFANIPQYCVTRTLPVFFQIHLLIIDSRNRFCSLRKITLIRADFYVHRTQNLSMRGEVK